MSRKGPKRTFRCSSYTAEAMRLAYLSVKSGQYTGRKAAAQFNVPYGTLNKKLSGRTPVDAHGAGRPIEISTEYEQKFAEYLKACGRYGYGYSRDELRDLVSEFVKQEGIRTRWPDGKPGIEWIKNFSRRHPQINVQKDENVGHKRMDGVDPFIVYQFYDDLKVLYVDEKMSDSDGDRIYDVCDILFRNNLEDFCKFATRCTKCVSKTPVNDSQLDTSVVVSVRADGEKLHPLVVFQGRCLLPACISNKKAPGTTYYTASARQWIEDTLFSYWFENVFIPQIPSKTDRSGKSVVILFDGSSLHVNIRCLQVAIKHNVIMVKLPPKLNKHLQPLSRTCLSVLKSAWDEQLINWEGESLPTIQKLFGQLLGIIWSHHFGKRIVRKAFLTTGVFPSDKDRFPVNVFSQIVLKRYTERDRQVPVRKRKVKLDDAYDVPESSVNATTELIIPDPIIALPSSSEPPKPNLFERFAYKKRSSSTVSVPLDLSKRKKSTDSNGEISKSEIKQEV